MDDKDNEVRFLLNEIDELARHIEKRLESSEDHHQRFVGLEILYNIKAIREGYDALRDDEYEYSDYWLASVAVGLNMYFSYFNVERMRSDINLSLASIGGNATSMLNSQISRGHYPQVSQMCGLHEDGACFIAPMTQRVDINKHNNPELGNDIGNFVTLPTKKTVRAGTKLYRVVGPNNLVKGAWWALDLPQNKTKQNKTKHNGDLGMLF